MKVKTVVGQRTDVPMFDQKINETIEELISENKSIREVSINTTDRFLLGTVVYDDGVFVPPKKKKTTKK